MAHLRSFFLASLLSALTSAHFKLDWPPARGYDSKALVQYPCGGQNQVSSERTEIPLDSPFPVQLDMHHTDANVQVLLAVGNDPSGDDFTYVLRPTFSEDGPRDFCVGGLVIETDNAANIREGTNGTILAVTNGDPSGGLFNCADITFTSSPLSSEDYDKHCSNSSGVKAVEDAALASKNANETSDGDAPSSGSSDDKPNTGARSSLSRSLGAVAIAVGVTAGLMALA